MKRKSKDVGIKSMIDKMRKSKYWRDPNNLNMLLIFLVLDPIIN